MKIAIKNVTITLDEVVARWARIEAASAGKSLSRWIGEKLAAEMTSGVDQRRGLDALLSLPLAPLSENGKLPARSEYYDREVFRRYERDRVHPRPTRAAPESEGD
jgi:hypothetical protein